MYYVNYDEQSGEILGIYPESYNYDDIPSPKIAITNDEWTALGDGYWVVRDGVLTEGSFTPIDYQPTDVGNYDDDNISQDEYNYEDYNTNIQNEYVKRFESLQNAYVGALIMGYTSMMSDIRRCYSNLLEEFRQMQTDYASDGDHEHCEICGRILEYGECPNCHWRK